MLGFLGTIVTSNDFYFTRKVKAVTYYTYVCDQSLDPKWTNQKFVFDIDPRAATQYRSYNLRLLVKAKSVVGIDNVLAKLDVPFSCLREEEVVEGWFPLRPSRSSMLLFKASGSIKLRLQWVHSEKGYVTFLHQQVDSRLRELQLQYDVQKYFRRAVEKQVSNQLVSKQNAFDSEVSYAEENDYYAMVERVAMQNSRKRSSIRMMSGKEMSSRKHTDSELEEVLTNDPSFSPLNSDDMRGRLSLTPIVGEEKVPESSLSALGTMPERLQYTPFSSIDNPREQTKSLRQVFRSNSFKKNRDEFAVLHYCDINMARWIRATAPLRHIHSQLSTCMARPRRLIEQNGVFRSQFDREGWRSYAHAFTQNGVLEIAPIQALHLPAGNNYVFVKISYGNEVSTYFILLLVPAFAQSLYSFV